MGVVRDRTASRWSWRVIVVLAAMLALYRYTWLPYEANHVLFEVSQHNDTAEMSDPLKGMPVARADIALLESVEAGCRTDANYHMLYAANARVLRRPDLARQHYDAALTIDRRPEIFMQRGLTALESGDVELAVPDFVRATRFSAVMAEQLDGELRERVLREAGAD